MHLDVARVGTGPDVASSPSTTVATGQSSELALRRSARRAIAQDHNEYLRAAAQYLGLWTPVSLESREQDEFLLVAVPGRLGA